MKMHRGVSDEGLARIAKTVKAQEGPPPEEPEGKVFEGSGDSDSKIQDLIHSGKNGVDWTYAVDAFGGFIVKNAMDADLNRAETRSYALAVLSRMEDYIRYNDDFLEAHGFQESNPSEGPVF